MAPAFTDLDGDGRLDLLVGNFDGTLFHYEQTAANAATFALVTTSFNGISVGNVSTPAFTDLDGDGLLDLLVGKNGSTLSHYEQTAANAPTFALVTTSFSGINVFSSLAPAFADLDGDGRLDLLMGKFDGTLSHYEQTAVNATTFALVTGGFNGIAVGGSAAPAFTDLDGDGLLDLLVGKNDGTLSHYEQALPVPTITSFSPASGAQGSTLTLTGTNLSTTTSVRFGELPATFVVNSAMQLTVTVPRGASTHRLRVTTPIGTVLSAAAFGVSKFDSYVFPLVTTTFNSIDAGDSSAPTFADLDGNGLLDMLVGKLDGTLSRYEQAAANAATFNLVSAGFNGIDVGDNAVPAFTDLDGDGLLDLLLGKLDGQLSHYEQTAANATAFTLVTATFNTLDVGTNAAPVFADVDGDGLLDLLVGKNDGTLSHYEQTAVNATAFALLTASFNTLDVGTNSAPTFTDLDGDGLLDMVVGKNDGTLGHYEQAPIPSITSFSPASGAQGSTLTITGTNLSGTTSVRFGELSAVFAVNSNTQLSVTVPRGASTHRLQVTTPGGPALSATAFAVSKLDSYLFPLVTNTFNSIDAGDSAAPAFADLDGDGLLDLLVGKQDGTLSRYEQTAANATTFNLVSAGFNTIDVGDNAAPTFTDLDGDGRLDLLVGKADGTLNHYEQAAPNSVSFPLVTASFNTLDVGTNSAPAFTDLDGDGRLDMLVGKLDGTLSHYEQTAANAAPFALVTASFNTLDVGDNAAPAIADLDGDGLLDLLVGKLDGTLGHYEQAAVNATTFTLVTAGFNAIAVGNNAAPAFTDLDGDGRLDMLVGKADGTLGHYEQVPPVPTITSFSPASGPQGSTLTITGTSFLGTSSVRFGELSAGFVVNSATQLTVTVPRGASTHRLHVTTPGGTALSATAFGVDKLNTNNFLLVTTSFNSIAVTSDAAPAVADLDGDGLLDLLVGEFDGTLKRYEQTAANATTFALVTATFSGIDVGNFSTPALTDLDGDGLLDLVVGENGGTLRHYEQAAPNSVSFPLVAGSFNGIAVGNQSTPAFTDLDGNGRLDLLVGEFDGNLNHYEQTTPNATAFALVTASFNGLDLGESSAPSFADLDGDGLLDLLVGIADGTLNHYEQATANATAFALVTASFSGIDVGDRSTPAFTDLDGDGRLDMLVGELDGTLNHYEQAFPVPTITSFSPASGPQGSTLTVTGTLFLGTTSVRFGELPAVFTVNSTTELSVTVPRGASTHKLRVTAPAGTTLSTTAFAVDKLDSYNFPLVTASFSGIDVGFVSTPAFTDLDGDGLLDMLVGENGGALRHYEQAAANAPTFTLVTATFNGIALGTRSTPAFTDLDGDGLLDMLVGKFDGTLNHYEQAAPNSTTFTLVTATFSGIDLGNGAVGDYSTPAFTDLDGDGLLDLLVGKNDGTLSHYEQTTANSPAFTLVTASFNGISVGNLSAPTFADLDGDGRLDMLVGNLGGTLSHYEQTAPNATTFTLVTTGSFNGISVSDRSAPAFTDLDGDGLLDLLVGKSDGTLSHYEQAGPPPTITSFSPANGPQGSLVTVTGTNFLGTTSVRFGGLPAVFTVNSATQLTVTVPRGASTHPLQLTAPGGTALSAAAFGVDKLNSYNFPLVTANFNGIDVGNISTPTFTDLDGDGLLDMLVGNTLSSNFLTHYEQAAPNSATFTLVTATFSALVVSSPPTFTDLDGNGLLDMLVGETAGRIRHYEQAAANSTTFTLVTTNFSGIAVGQSSAPVFTDLDGDGLLDMLVGTQAGTLSHYEQAPNSTTFTLVTASFNGINVGLAAKPAVADLDGDGLLDLLVGNSAGTLSHYEQAAPNATAFTLVMAGFNGIAVGGSAAPAFTDLDGDGLLDMVVGKQDGTLNRYEQAGPPPTITSFSPASGPQGSLVTVTGTNLATTTSVRFGELPAAFTVNSATQVTVTVPRGASTHPLYVSTPGGAGLSAAAFGVTKLDSYNFPLVTASFNTLDVGDSSTPAFADLDGNGLLDMLVGKFDGTLSHYEQTTANATTFALVTASFNTIDVGSSSAPALTDLDGDGLLDLLVGNSAGTLSHYEQTAANATTFALVTVSFNNIDVGSRSAPAFTDLDGDGRLDMLVGESFGILRHYEQTAANAPTFALVTATFNTIDVGNFSAPAFADLDGDGLLDLLVGNSGGNLSHYEQAATNSLTFALVTATFNTIDVGDNAAPFFTDLDGDGLLDLLIGKFDGTLSHYEQAPPVPTLAGLSPAAELPGMPVVLTGTGFTAGSTVSFGGVAAGSVTVNSPTSLTAVVPPGAAAGSSAVVVTTSGGSSLSAPAFAVLGVYDGGALDACAAAVPATASLNDGQWHYLFSSDGQVVAAYNYTGASLGDLTVDVLRANPAAAVRQALGSGPYLDRNWHLTNSAGRFDGRTVALRLYGLNTELARLQAAAPAVPLANLQATQYSGPNEDCDPANNSPAGEQRTLPAPATAPAGAPWFVAEMSVADHFSEFYLTGSAPTLPVELTAFRATAEGPAAVRLAWATASEQNSDRFEVERSADGRTFARIGRVAAAGSSSSARRYELLDLLPHLPSYPSALLYYRLKQVDADGTFAYSPVRSVAFTESLPHALTVFPNPATHAATLTGAVPGTVVTVYDALGRLVTSAPADAAGMAALVLPAGLAAGVYMVRAGAHVLRLTVAHQ